MDNQRLLILCGFCAALCCGFLGSTNAQTGARNSVPETISMCYLDRTVYDRYNRQPMHIDNLIGIIRKIEKREPQLDMRRLSRILVNRFMFDGIQFDPNARPEFAYNPQSEEATKNNMIKSYIPLQGEEVIPPGILDNEEWCALHWMLSHSMNSTVRDEELGIYPPSYNSGSGGYNSGAGGSYNNPRDSYNSPGGSYNNPGSNGGSYNNPGGSYNNPGTNYNSNPNNGGYNSGYSGQQVRGKRSIAEENPSDDHSKDDDEHNTSDALADLPQDDKEDEDVHDKGNSTEDEAEHSASGRSASGLVLVSDDDDGSQKFARQQSTYDPRKTRRPVETGVVYSKYGSISAGRLIAGVAAALQPMTIPVGSGSPYPSPNSNGYGPGSNGPGFGGNYPGFGSGGSNPNPNPNPNPFGGSNPFNSGSGSNANSQYGHGRRKRQAPNLPFQPLQNLHAATLAGDVGQAAVRNSRYPINVPPPKGLFNDTVCPREYILEQYPYSDKEIWMDSAAFTYMTEAEIRGGMDGLILGTHIMRWNNAGYKLSELLAMYYSEAGVAGEPQYRACNRGSLFNGAIDMTAVREQSQSFAYLYNNHSHVITPQSIIADPNSFIQLVSDSYNRMSGVASTIGSSDPQCRRRQSTASAALDTDDNLKYSELKDRVYVVIDHTATYDEIMAQKRFIGQLAQEIDMSPYGSRLGVVDGNSGQILISPNETDISPHLACEILSLPTQTKTQDLVRVFQSMRNEMQKLRDEEIRLNYEWDLGTVILVMVQGRRLDESQRSQIRQHIDDFGREYGDVRIIFTSSKYQQADFDGFVPDASRDFVRIQSIQNISDYADEFANEMRKMTHGRLSYTKCNANLFNQDDEHKMGKTFFVSPDTIQYYKIAPDYFYSAKFLRLRFTSDNGKVRICQSRDALLPNSRNQGTSGVICRETSGSYITPGNSQIDIEFEHSKPCGKNGNRADCKPIYLSFTPTEFPPPGQTGLDCAIEGCQSPNQVKVTFTHWDMRCNGSMRNMISLPTALLALLASLFFWKKSA